MAKVVSTEALALEGGPKSVTAPMNDRWEKVSALEKQYVNAVLDNYGSAYDEIEKFEAQFREFVGTRYALAHCNGTSTIHAAVFASGARRGKEVIVPSVTWHASITPILHCNAAPVFCDIDLETFCADPEDVRRKITPNTCAVIVTHVYGNPADMDVFREIVEGTDILLIEDASHAHGALWEGKPVGSLGDIGCFSMQGGKAVTGIEAGVATTNDADLYDRMLARGDEPEISLFICIFVDRRIATRQRKKARAKPQRRASNGGSGRRDSNPRHPAWKASALPTELLPQRILLISIIAQ